MASKDAPAPHAGALLLSGKKGDREVREHAKAAAKENHSAHFAALFASFATFAVAFEIEN